MKIQSPFILVTFEINIFLLKKYFQFVFYINRWKVSWHSHWSGGSWRDRTSYQYMQKHWMDRRSENCGAWCLGRGITSLPDVWSPSSVGACNHYSNIWSLCHFKGILDLLHLYIPISETHSKACPTLQASKPYTYSV